MTMAASCHGTGGAGTGIWTCGPDQNTCYTGIKNEISSTTPSQTTLYSALHKVNPGASDLDNMPLASDFSCCAYTFTDSDVMRIAGPKRHVVFFTDKLEAATKFYERIGFVAYGLERRALKLPDRYVDEVLMTLWL